MWYPRQAAAAAGGWQKFCKAGPWTRPLNSVEGRQRVTKLSSECESPCGTVETRKTDVSYSLGSHTCRGALGKLQTLPKTVSSSSQQQ